MTVIRTQEEIRQIVTEWRESGMNQAQFCKQQGLSPSSLSAWIRRNGEEAGAGQDRTAGGDPCQSVHKAVMFNSYPESFKKEIVEKARIHFGAGGLMKDFCEMEGVSSKSVRRWLGMADGKAASVAQPLVRVGSLPGPMASGTSSTVEISFHGATIRATGERELESVLRVLARISG